MHAITLALAIFGGICVLTLLAFGALCWLLNSSDTASSMEKNRW
jgi:hypothetical protein